MPKVKKAVANKDYPDQGIKKGDTYYSWAFFRQKPQRSKTYPRPSQLMQTNLSGAYAAQEALQDAIKLALCPRDLMGPIDDAVSEVQSVIELYEESLSNLYDAFPGGSPTIEDHENIKDSLERYVSDLEDAAVEIGQLDPADFVDEDVQVNGLQGEARQVKEFDDLAVEEQTRMMDTIEEIADQPSIDC